MYFLDPANGGRRRHAAVDRAKAFLRRSTAQRASAVGSHAHALKQKAAHLREEPEPQPNDATLEETVESELFRDPEVPKDSIDVNAEQGVVYLRDEVERPELIETLVARAREIPGVHGAESLLHLPGEPVPTRDS